MKTQLEDPLALVDVGLETWVLQGATGEVKLRGLLDRVQGSHGREPCQHLSSDVRTDRRSAIEWPGVKKGRCEFWRLRGYS